MKNWTGPIRNLAMTWPSEPKARAKHLVDPQDFNLIEVPMPKEIGSASMELTNLGPGLYFGQGRHVFRPEASGQRYASTKMDGELSEPIFIVRATRGGRITMQDNVAEAEMTYGGEIVAFQHVDQIDMLPILETSEAMLTSTLSIGESNLIALLGEKTARKVLHALRIRSAPAVVTQAFPFHIPSALHSCSGTDLRGDMRSLFMQGKVMVYLAQLADHVTSEASSAKHTLLGKKVRQLREELEELHGEPPSLHELACRYGMSARTLTEGFKKRYGLTIFAFIAEKGLSEAHIALEETDIAMKVIAGRLGYSNVSNFITAFKRKFGYTPGRLRRGFAKGDENPVEV